MGLAVGFMTDIALLLEDTHNGRNGVVGGFGFGHFGQNVVNQNLLLVPNHLHNLQFGAGEFGLALFYDLCHNSECFKSLFILLLSTMCFVCRLGWASIPTAA